MKKAKGLLSIMLAILMLCSMIIVGTNTVNAASANEWPGAAMTKLSGYSDIYYFEVPKQYNYVIFSDGLTHSWQEYQNGNTTPYQTADLFFPGKDKLFYPNTNGFRKNEYSVYTCSGRWEVFNSMRGKKSNRTVYFKAPSFWSKPSCYCYNVQLDPVDFTYAGSKTNHSAKCYYSQDYFSQSSTEYNSHLATMSMSMAWSSFNAAGGSYSEKNRNIKDLLGKIGFRRLYASQEWNRGYMEKPTTDSIGVISADQQITVNGEDVYLIAIVVRGGNYESEWASNFTIGASEQHKGFNDAKNEVLNLVRGHLSRSTYINGKVKLWITGYSRGGAVANLVAGEIDKNIETHGFLSDRISYSKNDVYAYCFEPPMGALKKDVKNTRKFDNIFNIVNPNDLVPKVAPTKLDFARYGIDRFLPTKANEPKNYSKYKKAMLKTFYNLPECYSYDVDDFSMRKLQQKNTLLNLPQSSVINTINFVLDKCDKTTQDIFLKKVIDDVSDQVKTRGNYTKYYQESIRKALSIIKGGKIGSEAGKFLKAFAIAVAKKIKNILKTAVWNHVDNSFSNATRGKNLLFEIYVETLKQCGEDLKNVNLEQLKKSLQGLLGLLLTCICKHPSRTITLLQNISRVAQAHYPELCYSWLVSMDSNYSTSYMEDFVYYAKSGYRLVRIKCDVDVFVTDSEGNRIASIVNEEPKDIEDSDYIYGVDEDGQKYVYLPVDEDYNIEIKARDNDTVNYSIGEFDTAEDSCTRNINFFDVSVTKGASLDADIPSYDYEESEDGTPEGSSSEYVLTNENNILVDADSDDKGEMVDEKTYTVNVEPSIENAGIIMGTGTHKYGESARLEVSCKRGYEFEGWYDGETLLSEENEYRLRVLEDTDIQARFVELPKTVDENGFVHEEKADNSIEITGYDGDETIISIPEMINDKSVTSVSDSAFELNDNATKIVIPDSVTKIGSKAFAECAMLNNIYVPVSVTSIEDYSIGFVPKYDDSSEELTYVLDEKTRIIGYSDSVADTYASDNNIDFFAIDKNYGDINMNGELNIRDATNLQRYLAKISQFTKDQINIADMNHDNQTNILDVTEIQKTLAGYYDSGE